VRDLHRALSLNPSNARALRQLGAIHSDAGQDDEALELLSAALEVSPTEPLALWLRSRLHLRNERHEEALKDADALVSIDQDVLRRAGLMDFTSGKPLNFRVFALTNRADVFESMRKPALAEKDLNEAVGHDWSPASLSARGSFYLRQRGREQVALNDLSEAVGMNPEDPVTQFNRGLALVHLRRYDEALQAFNKTIEIDPFRANAYRLRARMFRHYGRTSDAVQDFERAMTLNPRLIRETIPALIHGRYWNIRDGVPPSLTPALRHAIRDCMLDITCN
jgi:tetratricopeptide (TPR) repeat protein